MILTEQQAVEIACSCVAGLENKRHVFRPLFDDDNSTKSSRRFHYNYNYELCFYLGSINLGHSTMTYAFKFSDARSVYSFDGGVEINITKQVNDYLQQHPIDFNL